MKLKIKKLHPNAVIPKYQSAGAACFDLHLLADDGEYVPPLPGGTVGTFRTGLSFEIPEGHVMLVFSRSGHGFKHNVRLSNCVGVIDADYRGEVMVKLIHDGNDFAENPPMPLERGDRIAQAMIIPVQQVQFVEVDDLSDTERGSGGFGSTGK